MKTNANGRPLFVASLHHDNLTGFHDRQDFEDLRDERPDIFDLVGTRPQNAPAER